MDVIDVLEIACRLKPQEPNGFPESGCVFMFRWKGETVYLLWWTLQKKLVTVTGRCLSFGPQTVGNIQICR
jgi:hypothetical protein